MVHLGKQRGGMKTVACTNSPFIKGRVVNADEFGKIVKEDTASGKRRYCLKCYQRYVKQ